MGDSVTISSRTGGYQNLSRFRGELMGLAMLWVMLFHAYPFRFQVRILDEIKSAGFAGVDVFILLSAMGLYVSIRRTGGSLRDFYGRRAARILPAFWLVVGAYSLWLIAQDRIDWTIAVWSMSTLYYWFHVPGTFNWYVPALLAFYLLTPLYVRAFDRCPRKAWMTAAMFPLAYGIYRLTIPLGINYTEDFVNRLPAFALGILAGYYILEGRRLTARHALTWVLLALCGISLEALRRLHVFYISPCYVIAGVLMGFCLLAAKGISKLGEGPRRILRLLGSCSLEIYLLNVIITREFETLAPLLDRGPRHLFYYAVVYTLNILLALLLHRGIEAVRSRRERRASA